MDNYEYKEEIISSRVGFLGGSDGNMLSKIAGLGLVPSSALERLAICKGLCPVKDNDFKTEAMMNGDIIENQIFDMLKAQDERWQSNPRIVSKEFQRKNVGLLVHPDFLLVDGDNKIVTLIECKATNKNLKEARYNYANQLYIESVIGKEYAHSLGTGWKFNIKLCHYNTDGYDGTLYPEKIGLAKVNIHPLFKIGKAMDIIDEYLDTMTEYYREEIEAEYLPQEIREHCDAINVIMREIKEREDKVKEFKDKMYALMCNKDIKSIKTDVFNLTRVDDSESKTFDSRRFAEEHKTLYKKYLKTSKRKGYALLKLKGEKDN